MENLKDKLLRIKELSNDLYQAERALRELPESFKVILYYNGSMTLKNDNPAYIAAYAIIEKNIKSDIQQITEKINELVK